MKKLLLIAAVSSCVLATSAMALNTYCPNANDPQSIKKVDGKFEGTSPGGVLFVQKFGFTNDQKIGVFNSSANYLPVYHNTYGEIACNYANATLWLVKPAHATINNANKAWFDTGSHTSMCVNSDSFTCQFTVDQPAK